MNRDAIGAIAGVVGAAAVVASLVYLALQIRLSNRNYRIESARSVMSTFDSASWDMAKDPALRRITMTALIDYDSLDANDSSAFDLLMWRFLGNAADALTQKRQKLLDDASFEVIVQSLIVTIRSAPGWWARESRAHTIPPALRRYIEERLGQDTGGTWVDTYDEWKGYGGS